jgi:SAM-dependent methyltransferase
LQPIEGRAEAIPFPDDSIDRAIIVHSAYEFDDMEAFLAQMARVMKKDAWGGLITNGPGDKQLLKQKMQEMKGELESDYPGEISYEVPPTVSSNLTYLEARAALKRYFNKVILFTYNDRMRIDTINRRAIYDFGFDTYKSLWRPSITNYGRWKNARKKIFGDPPEDPETDMPVLHDTIDIGWVLFSDPKTK